MAKVTITIEDEMVDDSHAAVNLETATDWKAGEPTTPAILLALSVLKLVDEVKREVEGEGLKVGGTD